MNTLLGWLFGTVTAAVTGAQPEDFLNRCAKENLILWKMVRQDPVTLIITVTGSQYTRLCQVAQQAQCTVELQKKRGVPYFFLRFRRRYALLIGLILCVCLLAVGSRTILTFDITGNETVTAEEIISQLRLCGVSVGTYGPHIPIRVVENKMMLAMDQLTYFSLNLQGTRAEVIVRERDPTPAVREQAVPTQVISSATGIITHIEPWTGDACFQEGETVCKGEVLIEGRIQLDPPPLVEAELGTMLVHAEGTVLARTWHTITANLDLNAPAKAYTGRAITRRSLSVMGRRMNFYQNSGIPYENYDTIIQSKTWTPARGKTLPIVWQTETIREYEPARLTLDPAQAEELLRRQLLGRLNQNMDQGKVLSADYEVTTQDQVLSVTLLAQCTEQIGRMVPMDTQEKAVGPRHPEKGKTAEENTAKEQNP